MKKKEWDMRFCRQSKSLSQIIPIFFTLDDQVAVGSMATMPLISMLMIAFSLDKILFLKIDFLVNIR
jgi:hypothetical protein